MSDQDLFSDVHSPEISIRQGGTNQHQPETTTSRIPHRSNKIDDKDEETESSKDTSISSLSLKKLMSSLECPVCLTLPECGPIYQCRNGHLLCKDCHPSMEQCPLCNIPLEKLRNLLSEKIISMINPEYQFSIDRSTDPQEIIWRGRLNWKNVPQIFREVSGIQCMLQSAQVNIKSFSPNGTPEVVSTYWPSSLGMQLWPISIIKRLEKKYFSNAFVVQFDLPVEEDMKLLKRYLCKTGLSGTVQFVGNPRCEIKILILLFSVGRDAFIGFIPHDQKNFIQHISAEIQAETLRNNAN